ncbi:hypothetical protein JQ574_25370 [Bradyrhizobium sp. AUGA SZCCT0158]|uniref:hypothetical protein n=1 Tax=Bradyrhizobium sp. AUGA SZCCT0158 TaxID=2807661 RepID=UPI001BA96E14|nr:hypothetical protein [Bradyrhizobium sp. AUGA SZCCT0158]MBR1199332.1 hypothetical protein [Bradyrhizobium sp. AUGA SZCCT0158]
MNDWTALQTEICINVANAKFHAFIHESKRIAEFRRLGFVNCQTAADYLHETAIYNQLYFEYGTDRIQKVMAEALGEAAA